MVKSGAERAEKYGLKYDAYCAMLRAKKVDKLSINRFWETLLLRVRIQDYISKLDLPYGQKGEFGDLVQQFLFKGTDILADLERFEIPLSYFEELLDYISTIIHLFHICAYPTSKLFSRITLDPTPDLILFPKKEDYVLDLTELSEIETYLLEPERKEVGIMEIKVCCHNVVSVLSPLFAVPVIDVDVWQELGALTSPEVAYFDAEKVEITCFSLANEHNAYKLTPTLTSEVVKTP